MAAKVLRIYLGKGLSRSDAWKKLISKRISRDFRGMKYSSKTGWAVVL